MGYSHYWRRPRTITDAVFRAICSDFEKLILPLSNAGVELAGGLGAGLPEMTDDRIWFNGLNDCGHPSSDELGLVYPSEYAQGIGPASTAIDGGFYNLGVTVKHRCCGGSCSCETFLLDKSLELRPGDAPDETGLYCESVKTAFRPYDIAVTAVLLIAKRQLRERLLVHGNGADAQWSDAKRICQQVLGYGNWFGIVEEEILDEGWPGSEGVTRVVKFRRLIEVEPPKLG